MTQKEMEQKIADLERKLADLTAQVRINAETDPQIRRSIEQIIGNVSPYVPTDYDRVVNENGVLSYQVPDAFDGLSIINGKLYGYYNP